MFWFPLFTFHQCSLCTHYVWKLASNAMQHAAAVVDGKLYIIGGSRNGRYLSDVQVLSILVLSKSILSFIFYKFTGASVGFWSQKFDMVDHETEHGSNYCESQRWYTTWCFSCDCWSQRGMLLLRIIVSLCWFTLLMLYLSFASRILLSFFELAIHFWPYSI